MTMGLAELQQQPKGEPRGKRQLHAVVLPYPAKGHSIPLLHFAKRLHSMDVVVTFVNTFNHLSKEHFRTLDGLGGSSMRVVPLGVTPPEGEGHQSLPYVEHVNELVTDAEVMVAELFAKNEDAPPACIISDMFLGWTQVSSFSCHFCNRFAMKSS